MSAAQVPPAALHLDSGSLSREPDPSLPRRAPAIDFRDPTESDDRFDFMHLISNASFGERRGISDVFANHDRRQLGGHRGILLERRRLARQDRLSAESAQGARIVGEPAGSSVTCLYGRPEAARARDRQIVRGCRSIQNTDSALSGPRRLPERRPALPARRRVS